LVKGYKDKKNCILSHIVLIMEIKQKVGVRLRDLRLKSNMTQEGLAKMCGIERTFISHIEKGSRNVSIETLEKIFIGLGISFRKFFDSN
jgi:transcriptional regulator with XRE-family HTH domain